MCCSVNQPTGCLPPQIVTVNCARIIHGNQVASNGVVHVIDRVITAVSNTIQEQLETDDDLTSFTVSSPRGQSMRLEIKRSPVQIPPCVSFLGFYMKKKRLMPN